MWEKKNELDVTLGGFVISVFLYRTYDVKKVHRNRIKPRDEEKTFLLCCVY